jgi:hypothetical protein
MIGLLSGPDRVSQWQVSEVETIKPGFTLETSDRILPMGNARKKEELLSLLRQAGFKNKKIDSE